MAYTYINSDFEINIPVCVFVYLNEGFGLTISHPTAWNHVLISTQCIFLFKPMLLPPNIYEKYGSDVHMIIQIPLLSCRL